MSYVIDVAKDILTSDLNYGWLNKSSAYELKDFDGLVYIVCSRDKTHWPRFRDKGPKQLHNFDYNKLLISTIGLINDPKKWDWNELACATLDWHTSFKDVFTFEKVGQWLTDYGLPSGDDELHHRHVVEGYSLQEFKIHVANLFLMYQIQNSIIEGGNVKQYAVGLASNPLWNWTGSAPSGGPVSKTITERYAKEAKAKWCDDVLRGDSENALMSAQHLMSVVLDSQVKNITLNYSFGESRFYWHAKSLFDICYYQLAMLTTLDLSGQQEHRHHVKNCVSCGGQFYGHGNKRYCDHCDRRTIWDSKHRK